MPRDPYDDYLDAEDLCKDAQEYADAMDALYKRQWILAADLIAVTRQLIDAEADEPFNEEWRDSIVPGAKEKLRVKHQVGVDFLTLKDTLDELISATRRDCWWNNALRMHRETIGAANEQQTEFSAEARDCP